MPPEQQNPGQVSVAPATPSDVEELQLLVSPTTSNEVNTLRSNFTPKACFHLEDSHFEFDSSFILPLGLTFDGGPLKTLLDQHPGSKLSIFGHTDPVGKDDFNKILSGRRAQAVFGLLVRDVKLWEDLYFHHDTQGRDKWGVRSVQVMLNFAGPTKAGTVDGKLNPDTRKALADFEAANNLPPKGFNQKQEIDPATFRVLAPLYMDAICTDDDGNKFQLTPDDFLARGKGKDGKGDFQGCGEFNPLMMFSKEERAFFDKEANKEQRNKENQINRRIMILLYRAGSRIDPERWPCPSVKEGIAGCIKRFHANAKDRRNNLAVRREHKNEKDQPDMVGTFACRFYERQTSDSPCEGVVISAFGFWDIPLVEPVAGNVDELVADAQAALAAGTGPGRAHPVESLPTTFSVRLYDPFGQFIPEAPFEFSVGNRNPVPGKADSKGVAILTDIDVPNRCVIRWGFKPNDSEPTILNFTMSTFLTDPMQQDIKLNTTQRLHNMGYLDSNSSSANVSAFQRDHGQLADPPLRVTGSLDPQTTKLINDVYELCAGDLRKTRPPRSGGQ